MQLCQLVIRQLINHVKWISKQQADIIYWSNTVSLTHLTNSSVYIFRALQTVFTSASCLNASFLDQREHYNTSTKNPGIDVNQARTLFNLISKADPYVIEMVNRRRLKPAVSPPPSFEF